MNSKNITKQLRAQCHNKKVLPQAVLDWIGQKNLWNLWVPREYGGLESSFTDGLQQLKSLAKIDGSLGWTITLCSGANFFIGNLKPETAQTIFHSGRSAILGGSGGVFGTAQKQGDEYLISDQWRYATGAPYLTYFTLNAKIMEKGEVLKNNDGGPEIRSFVLPQDKVEIVDDWNTMGLLATATCSFRVEDVTIHKDYSFLYDHFYLPQAIYKISFSLFADLTTWVNYLGMGEHYLEEAEKFLNAEKLKKLRTSLQESLQHLSRFSKEVEEATQKGSEITENYQQKVHKLAADSVRQLSQVIIEIHPFLGIKASRQNHQLNVIFRDFFTATQHHIFVDR